MKYAILIGDGMSDEPVAELGGRTPLMAARTPNLDRIVREGIGGWCRNTPDGFPPGSDVCNLAILGYDVRTGYTGRSPLEAAAMGVDLGPDDVAFRCNLVTLSDDGATMRDFSAGHIGNDEAAALITEIQARLGTAEFEFHPGVSYRHLLVWRGGRESMSTTPPHDITDQPVEQHLPRGEAAEVLLALMRRSSEFLPLHPVNRARAAAGKPIANSIWLWGQGRQPRFTRFAEARGLKGAMITAVDLMRGIAANIGFENIQVPGATGWIDTNYEGKAAACIEAFDRADIVCVHVESPDESGHAGRLDYKLRAIEDFDAKIVGPIADHLRARGDYRVVSLPDHPTPVARRTHTRDNVPFALCGTGIDPDGNLAYDERLLTHGSAGFDPGHRMLDFFLR